MKILSGSAVLALACLVTASAQSKPVQHFQVQGPAIIAFFPAVTDDELEKNADTNEALADFQLYATQASPRLKKAGIDFEVISATTFQIRVGKRVRRFRTGKIGIGYYFIAPGRQPRIEYGVMTDDDLLTIARQYFKIVP